METIKKYLPWTFRIIIFLLFIVSGIAKMFPLWAFEKQLVDLGISSWCFAPYLSRGIIALELALAFAILQPHYLKRLVIPITIFLLVAFNIHLTVEMVKHGAMSGNCGCFGQLIPMTPLEAFIKNILTIGLLIYLYYTVKDKPDGQNKLSVLSILYLGSTLFMFVVFPFCPCKEETSQELDESLFLDNSTSDTIAVESLNIDIPDVTIAAPVSEVTEKPVQPLEKKENKSSESKSNQPVEAKPEPPVEKEPEKQKSKFAEFTKFGTKQVNLDQGKKIVALFAPGCDHCKETARELCKLSKTANFPEVYILFMDEETELIPAFFKEAQCLFPYQVLDISKFWKVFGRDGNTPGLAYLWNGNIVKFYEGIKDNAFKSEDLIKQIETKYK